MRTNSASMKESFLEVFGPLLPQISVNFAEFLTRGSTLSNKNFGWKFLWRIRFYGKGKDQMFAILVQLWLPVSPWRWLKSKTISCSNEKFQQLGDPNMSKPRLISSPLSGKIRLVFAVFGLFLGGNRAGSQVKRSESKFDISYFTQTIPGQIPVKKIGSITFQFCGYRSQRTFQKNFNPDFQIWLFFLVPRLKPVKFTNTVDSLLLEHARRIKNRASYRVFE